MADFNKPIEEVADCYGVVFNPLDCSVKVIYRRGEDLTITADEMTDTQKTKAKDFAAEFLKADGHGSVTDIKADLDVTIQEVIDANKEPAPE